MLHRAAGAPPLRDGKLMCGNCGGDVYLGTWGELFAWRCHNSPHHHQKVIKAHLRLPEMRALVRTRTGPSSKEIFAEISAFESPRQGWLPSTPHGGSVRQNQELPYLQLRDDLLKEMNAERRAAGLRRPYGKYARKRDAGAPKRPDRKKRVIQPDPGEILAEALNEADLKELLVTLKPVDRRFLKIEDDPNADDSPPPGRPPTVRRRASSTTSSPAPARRRRATGRSPTSDAEPAGSRARGGQPWARRSLTRRRRARGATRAPVNPPRGPTGP